MPKAKRAHNCRGGEVWLYRISETSLYHFADDTFETNDTSFESFAAMMDRASEDPRGDLWPIHTNRKRVKVGDQILVYSCMTKSRSPLLVGLGQVVDEAAWVPGWEKWAIRIRWDRSTTSALCRSPVDATYLKDRLPRQKAAVVALSPQVERWARNALENARQQAKP